MKGFGRELCENAKKGRRCGDDLCYGGDLTLCGFDKEAYDRDVMEFDDYDDIDDDPEFEFDCGMDRDGLCGMAGSEDCEFECPVRQEQYAAERRKAAKETK